MATDVIHFESISQLCEVLNYEKPSHPLITVIDAQKLEIRPEWVGQRFSGNLYSIMLKTGPCGMQYGRNHLDFEEGVLVFTAPNQVTAPTEENSEASGWMLFFHPDLIRKHDLGKRIGHYNFFSYETNEALHLSDREKALLNDSVQRIQEECQQNIDGHSETVLVSHLQLMLDYSNRFYERQFHTRSNQNKDVLSIAEYHLSNYFESETLTQQGPPTVAWLADQVHLSPNYLSDLLKRETGKNAKEHINSFVVSKAKTMLLGSDEPVSQIAYDLGFNYPHYFSRMFKAHTGFTPKDFRNIN